MSLPLPNKPEGCILITFQANIEGYEQSQRILSPHFVSKLLRYCEEQRVPTIVDGQFVQAPRYPGGMSQIAEEVLDKHLLQMVDDIYRDPPDPSIAELEAQLDALKSIKQPKFIDPQE